jgi:hypothetical protein
MLLDRISASPPKRQFPNAASELGAFFTIDPDEAARYADIARSGTGGRVYPADVPLKNPKEMTWGDFGKFSSVEPSKIAEAKALRKELEAAGHDGIIVRNTKGLPIEIASFKDVPLDQRVLPLKPSITAYHGSPHDFDKFSLEKIGTGEGAQAYGHGLYFAENQATAEGYRASLAGQPEIKLLKVGNKTAGQHNDFDYSPRGNSTYENIQSSLIEDLLIDQQGTLGVPPDQLQAHVLKTLDGKIADYEKEWPQAVADAKRLRADIAKRGAIKLEMGERPGKTYEVQIHASPDQFLDWDKPLSEQTPEATSRARKALDAKYGAGTFDTMAANGADARDLIGNFDDLPIGGMEKALHDAGIPGIRYLDAGSRAAGEGSRNFVIFDDSLVSILKKYGVALPVIEGLRERAKQGGGVVPTSDVHGLLQ